MKYRKLPVEIEAMLFRRDSFEDIVKFTGGKATYFRIEKHPSGKAYCTIETLEGNHTATEGDYIIKGVAGEFYPCKPDIFKATYEPIIESIPLKDEYPEYFCLECKKNYMEMVEKCEECGSEDIGEYPF